MILWLRILQGIGITTLAKEEICEYERLRNKQTRNKKHAYRVAAITALDDKDNLVPPKPQKL
jgi:hypothetical protein